MKTVWKVLVTVGVVVLFILVFSVTAYFLGQGMDGAVSPSVFRNKVMVIPVYGMITFGGCGGGLLTGSLACTNVPQVKRQLEEASRDSTVGAVLLDINSGGGSVVASRELMRVVEDFDKPVVSWIGDTGASGAYYVASASDFVMADRNSLTGSIGVIMQVPHYYGFMDEWGFNMTTIKAGKTKDIGSPYRPMTEGEKEELEGLVDKIYFDFVTDVADNRDLNPEYVESLSQGQIFLGSEAVENGLIDGNGGYDEALMKAAELGGIKGEPDVKMLEEQVSFLDLLS